MEENQDQKKIQEVRIPHIVTHNRKVKRTETLHEREHGGYKLIAVMSLITILLLLLGGSIYVGIAKKKPMLVTSFEECASLSKSIIQESYPEVCVTPDGQSFVHEVDAN